MEVNSATKDNLLVKFNNFYDAVIQSILIEFQNGRKTAKIQLETKEWHNDDATWSTILITVLDVEDIIIREDEKHTFQVLSPSGLVIWIEKDLIYVDFFPYTDEPASLEDIYKSDCLFSGRRCDIGKI